MKQYLNADEKNNIAFLMAIADHVYVMLPDWEKNLTAQEKKLLKTALTDIKKASFSIIERIDKASQMAIVKRLRGTVPVLMPKDSAEQLAKRYEIHEKKKDVCVVNLEAFYRLAEAAFQGTCNPCQCKEPKQCAYRTSYEEIELPYYDITNTECPFMISREESCEQALEWSEKE